MPNAEILIRRLVQVKQIFLHGRKHSVQPGEINRILAILLIDQAIEALLRTSIVHNDIDPKKNSMQLSFVELFNVVSKDCENRNTKEPLPYKTEVLNIHNNRNFVQHTGSIPSQEDVVRFIKHSEDFLEAAFLYCFNKNYNEIFLADIIEFDDVRQFFKEAEEAFLKDDISEAVVALAKSFKFLEIHMDSNLPWTNDIALSSWPEGEIPASNAIKETIGMVEHVNTKINIVAYGCKPQDYDLFQKIMPVVNVTVGGKIMVHNRVIINEITKEETLRMFNFVFNMIVADQSLN